MAGYRILENVAVSDSGFLFLASTGETFTVNEVGREIIKGLQSFLTQTQIEEKIAAEYGVDSQSFERDYIDFLSQLKSFGLVKEV